MAFKHFLGGKLQASVLVACLPGPSAVVASMRAAGEVQKAWSGRNRPTQGKRECIYGRVAAQVRGAV